MKICVYAISKNEENFVKRFCESIKDADYILIADTGSTDNTVAIAKEYGAIVYNIAVHPWRFDTARNITLGLVPRDMDICITLDLDEIMLPGWRNAIEKVWIKDKTELLRHRKIEENDEISYEYTNIYCRTNRIWIGICHENFFIDSLENKKNTEWAFSDKILIKHMPDKTKSREMYTDLLKANVKEYPNELLCIWNYIRQLQYSKKFEKCIKVANKFINLYQTNLKYSEMHYKYHLNIIYTIKGSCYILLNNFFECEKNYKLACDMNMQLRRPLILLARLYSDNENYKKSYKYYTEALSIKTQIHKREEIDYWGYIPLNAASQVAAKLGNYDKAEEYRVRALSYLK